MHHSRVNGSKATRLCFLSAAETAEGTAVRTVMVQGRHAHYTHKPGWTFKGPSLPDSTHLGVEQDGHAPAVELVVRLDLLHHLLVARVVTVAHVHAAHVHALVAELADLLERVRRRPDGGHNLGLAHVLRVEDVVVHRVQHASGCIIERERITARTCALGYGWPRPPTGGKRSGSFTRPPPTAECKHALRLACHTSCERACEQM